MIHQLGLGLVASVRPKQLPLKQDGSSFHIHINKVQMEFAQDSVPQTSEELWSFQLNCSTTPKQWFPSSWSKMAAPLFQAQDEGRNKEGTQEHARAVSQGRFMEIDM